MLFILKIDVGNGNLVDLPVDESSDPRLLSMNFCKKHNLVDDASKILEENIRFNIDNTLK